MKNNSDWAETGYIAYYYLSLTGVAFLLGLFIACVCILVAYHSRSLRFVDRATNRETDRPTQVDPKAGKTIRTLHPNRLECPPSIPKTKFSSTPAASNIIFRPNKTSRSLESFRDSGDFQNLRIALR